MTFANPPTELFSLSMIPANCGYDKITGYLYRVGKSGGSFTLTSVCSFPNTPGQAAAITNISEVNNAYYFILAGYGLMKTTDFVSFQTLLPWAFSAYCITNTGAGIVARESSVNNGIIYNIHP